MDVEEIGWIDLANDKDKWRVLMYAVMQIRVKRSVGTFFYWLRNYWLPKKNYVPWSWLHLNQPFLLLRI